MAASHSFIIPPSVRQELELFARLFLALPPQAQDEIEALVEVLAVRHSTEVDEAILQAMILPFAPPFVLGEAQTQATGTGDALPAPPTPPVRGVTVEYRVLGTMTPAQTPALILGEESAIKRE